MANADIAMPSNIQMVPIEEIIPYARNARKHSDEHVKQIAASIKEFGFRDPVEISDNNTIIAGHGRVLALGLLGAKQVPCIVHGDLDKSSWRAYNLVNNKLTDNSEWDLELLKGELEDLKTDFDFEALGFDLSEYLPEAEIHPPGEGQEDEIPEQVETRCKPGDLWILGEHRLLCGDSTNVQHVERLMSGDKADMVFTDPPYGVNYDGGHAIKGIRREKLANDDTAEIYADILPLAFAASEEKAALYLWFSDSKSAAVTAAVTAAGYDIRNTLIWNKNLAQFGAIGAQYKSKHEPCLYCFKRGRSPYWNGPNNEVSVWDISRSSKNEFHPTQKPVELAERAIGNSCPPQGRILDLFLGSGSTLIACEKTGRKCYGMEIDPHYCDVIIERWEKYSGKTAILEESDASR